MPAGRVELIPATEVIENEEQPALAVRRKRDSSIIVGMRRVGDGAGDVFVSCGSTGALMTAGLLVFGRLAGVRRPALGSAFPDLANPGGQPWFMLDIGANVDATAEDLLGYAIIGSVYADLVMSLPKPRVGLLNVGVEDHKGSETYRRAHGLLKASALNFAGNVEARDLFSSRADVVVCDGFVGNVLLKGLEGLVGALAAGMHQRLFAVDAGGSSRVRRRTGPRRRSGAKHKISIGRSPIFWALHGPLSCIAPIPHPAQSLSGCANCASRRHGIGAWNCM